MYLGVPSCSELGSHVVMIDLSLIRLYSPLTNFLAPSGNHHNT